MDLLPFYHLGKYSFSHPSTQHGRHPVVEFFFVITIIHSLPSAYFLLVSDDAAANETRSRDVLYHILILSIITGIVISVTQPMGFCSAGAAYNVNTSFQPVKKFNVCG